MKFYKIKIGSILEYIGLIIFLTIFGYLCLVFFRWSDTGVWDIKWAYSIITGNYIKRQVLSGGTVIGGDIETGIKIELTEYNNGTGDNNQGKNDTMTNIDLYNQYKSKNNYRSYFPEGQSRIIGNYGTNTEYMTNYLSNHTFKFSLPEGVSTGYLYIRIKKVTDNDIFAYWYKSNDKNGYTVSGDLDKTKSLISGSQTEFLYKLENIPYKKYYDKGDDTYNWLSQLQKDNNYIALFVKDFDGLNQVEEMTIARE